MSVYRTVWQQLKYDRDIKRGDIVDLLDVKPLQEWDFFKLIPAKYPHSKISKMHHMLIPKRRVAHWNEFSQDEVNEFKEIEQNFLQPNYDSMLLNFPALQSVPDLVHFHVYKIKKEKK